MTCHYDMIHDACECKFSIMPLYKRSALKKQKMKEKMKGKCLRDISRQYVRLLLLYPGKKKTLNPKR